MAFQIYFCCSQLDANLPLLKPTARLAGLTFVVELSIDGYYTNKLYSNVGM